MGSFRTSQIRVVAEGLAYPEGPVCLSDGSVIVVEVLGGRLTRIDPQDGSRTTLATVPGGPNGAAIGPDQALYVCNDGGFWSVPASGGIRVAMGQSKDYVGGSIQRFDFESGSLSTLYTSFEGINLDSLQDGPLKTEFYSLRSPDDLVFDKRGGFWFTDWGQTRFAERVRDLTGVYYARPDGSSIIEVIFPLAAPNGIALSPAEDRLYVAETYSRRILFWELTGPGTIRKNPRTASSEGSYLLTAKLPGTGILDSMAVDERGNVWAVTMLPEGNDSEINGGITVISPDGSVLEFIELDVPGGHEPLPSNLCFGGPNLTTVYVTLGGSGRLAAFESRVAGKPLAWAR
jgi:gluconolactonase